MSKGSSSGSSGFGGRPGAAIRAGNARAASYVTATSGRETAIVLVVAILLARLVLTNQLQQFWSALWGQSRPLGQALPRKVATNAGGTAAKSPASGGGGSAGSF